MTEADGAMILAGQWRPCRTGVEQAAEQAKSAESEAWNRKNIYSSYNSQTHARTGKGKRDSTFARSSCSACSHDLDKSACSGRRPGLRLPVPRGVL
jgi:hypothetical protein